MRLIILQFEAVWHQVEHSLAKLSQEFAKLFASPKQPLTNAEAVLVVLPEMFASGFSMQPEKFSEQTVVQTIEQTKEQTIESQKNGVSQALSQLARHYQVQILAGVVQHERLGEYHNRALWFDEQGVVKAQYSKQKLFRYANEHHFYRPGKRFTTTRLAEGVQCGIFICYDLRFPELFRHLAKSVQMVVVIANWPQSREEHWQSLLKARAIENQFYVLGVNRVGMDGNQLVYSGHSLLFGPSGELILDAEQKPVAEIMLEPAKMAAEVADVRQRFPVLEDMSATIESVEN